MTNICTKRANTCTKRVKIDDLHACVVEFAYNSHMTTTREQRHDMTHDATHDASRATRRRDMHVDDLRVTTHAINVLRVMRDEHATIFYDDETCVIMTRDRQRKISHKCVKSLRAMRFIRARENDVNVYALTNRAHDLLSNDARTRSRRSTSCTTSCDEMND